MLAGGRQRGIGEGLGCDRVGVGDVGLGPVPTAASVVGAGGLNFSNVISAGSQSGHHGRPEAGGAFDPDPVYDRAGAREDLQQARQAVEADLEGLAGDELARGGQDGDGARVFVRVDPRDG